jgi:CheY-like chemotaxis protein/signal transduction histidine kinase
MKINLLSMTKEDENQNWLKTGQAKLNEKLRGEQEVNELAQNVINYVASYMDVQVGAIYLKNESAYLDMVGSYAYTKRKNLANRIKIGEGLVGQSALEKKDIIISNIPDDYIKINSGLGESSPLNILVMPFLYEDQIKGVIELGSFQEFDDLHMQFLKQMSENVAIAFHTAESGVEMKKLLEESRQKSEELQSQQEELRVTNEELEEQTQSLKDSEEKLKKQQADLKNANQGLEEQTINLTERQVEIEKKNAELEVARGEIEVKAEELELTSKYKSEFLANMSHELRTPLNSVLILSKLLLENKNGNLEKKQVDFAKTINSSGSDLLGLINEILDLSKIESGKMIINIEDVSLTQLPSYIQQNLQHLAEEKGLYLKVELEKGLPEKMTTDRQRVEQVIKNLMSNAIKFTQEGGITVNIHRPSALVNLSRSGLEHKKAIAISVSDTGVGIPEDKQKLIFEAFQQADGTTSRKFGGTGLGLSISREIAKILGGEIQLQSEAGKGSTFTLYLPESVSAEEVGGVAEITEAEKEAVRETEKEVEEKTVAKKEKKGVEEIRDDRQDITAGDKSILIVEDDLKFAKILFDFTREKGFKCLIACDGEAGLQMATQYLPSAVILDVGLPRMDGWTVMERLKDNAETRHIPVYFISGQDKKMEAMKMGAIGYLTKPVNAEDINSVFSKIEDTISKDIRKLLVVEDDETMRNSILELIGNGDVTITATGKGEDALKFLHKDDFDCMVLDLGLSDISGFDLLKKISADKKISDIPIIIYTGKELTKKEETGLRKYAKSIIVKGAKSPDRLLDEVSLFLHRVESDLPEEQQTILKMQHDKEEVFKDKKILIADDDVRNIFALSSILEEKEIQLVPAENGIEAVEALKKDPKIDLVLMDIMMPEMDGYEAMREIRKQKQFKKLPIIALTAKAMKGDRQKCIAAGANDYLSKPVDVEKLLSLLRVWLYK